MKTFTRLVALMMIISLSGCIVIRDGSMGRYSPNRYFNHHHWHCHRHC